MINLFLNIGTVILLLIVIKKQQTIMATLAEFQAAFAEINETTNNIAADIERLAGQIGAGMSEADEAAALSELQGIATRLKSIADVTPE